MSRQNAVDHFTPGSPVKASDPIPRNLEDLPPTIPLQVASRILGIGRDHAYELARAGTYPVRVLESNGRLRVSKFDLLAYLGAVPREPARQNLDALRNSARSVRLTP
jgi:hypothetical protein